jgi:microcystin-dependent protein
LFAAIGIAHGQGDGTTTFNLPDYRGKFLRSVDGGAGNDPDTSSRTAMAIGGNSGDAVGSVQGHQFASHNHTAYHATVGSGNDSAISGFGTGRTTPTDFQSQYAGGNETRPINAYVYYAIKF